MSTRERVDNEVFFFLHVLQLGECFIKFFYAAANGFCLKGGKVSGTVQVSVPPLLFVIPEEKHAESLTSPLKQTSEENKSVGYAPESHDHL